MRHEVARHEPEVYMRKAEEDITRAEIAASLRDPPWDGEGAALYEEDIRCSLLG